MLIDWDIFHKALLQRFPAPPSISNAFEYFQQLSNRRQGIDEPTVDYYTNVLKLCHNYNPQMSDTEQVDHLKKGLRPSLLEKVLDREPTTPTDFIAVVLKAESNQRILQVQFETGTNTNSNNINHPTIDQPRRTPNINSQQRNNEPQQHEPQRWSGNQQRRHPGPNGGPTCYTCGQQGHISPACHLNWR